MARTGVRGSGSKMDDVVEENRNHKHAEMVIQEINLSLMYYFPYCLHFSLLMETAEIRGTGNGYITRKALKKLINLWN